MNLIHKLIPKLIPQLIPAVLVLSLCCLVLGPEALAGKTAKDVSLQPTNRLVIEGALAIPYGDLNDNFEDTDKGFGADNGYVVGFRYRIFLSPTVSIAPSFHFVDFGNFNGVHPEVEEFSIETTSLRTSLELMVMSPYRSFGKPRPFLAMGAGIFRNRVQGYYSDYLKPLDESVNSLGLSFRGGMQIGGFELSLVYNLNRFNTWHFHEAYNRPRYNWDTVETRVGWVVPFK